MAGFYGGSGVANSALLHNLDTKDGDDVGPGQWTLKVGATIEATNARFGNNLNCDAGQKIMDSDVAVSTFDDSDGQNVLYHLFWTASTLSFNRTMAGIVNSGHTKTRTRILFDIAGGRILVSWTRKTDLSGPNTQQMTVISNPGLFTTGPSFTIVGFVDSGSPAKGKVFINGVDQTFRVENTGILPAVAGTLQHARLGNHTNGLDPGQFVDELTMVQIPGMDNAKATDMVDKYGDTQQFGHRPKFGSVEQLAA